MRYAFTHSLIHPFTHSPINPLTVRNMKQIQIRLKEENTMRFLKLAVEEGIAFAPMFRGSFSHVWTPWSETAEEFVNRHADLVDEVITHDESEDKPV